MTKHEEKLIWMLGMLDTNDTRVIVLQGFIHEHGPLSEEAGEKVREILAEKHDG